LRRRLSAVYLGRPTAPCAEGHTDSSTPESSPLTYHRNAPEVERAAATESLPRRRRRGIRVLHENRPGGDLPCHASRYRAGMSDDAFYRPNHPGPAHRQPSLVSPAGASGTIT
jgi:hypothetical protein